MRRLIHLLIALDQLLWVIVTLGHGSPDETISAALWRWELTGRWQGRWVRPVVDFLFRPFEADHCRNAYEAERRRGQLPHHYQD